MPAVAVKKTARGGVRMANEKWNKNDEQSQPQSPSRKSPSNTQPSSAQPSPRTKPGASPSTNRSSTSRSNTGSNQPRTRDSNNSK